VTDPRMLLLWDSPNIDMVLGQLILRRKPTGRERPRIDALRDWLRERADDTADPNASPPIPRPKIEASVFANVTERTFNGVVGWAEVVRQSGFRMFLKPKFRDDSDVDEDILNLLAERHREGGLREAILMSHDGMAFVEAAKTLIADGVHVTALVFPEHAHQLCMVDGIEVFDLEDIPGLFESALPRLTFASLPETGRWLEPIGEI
jgi:uncharacterized protein